VSSGKSIEVLMSGTAGPQDGAHFWFEYKSSVATSAELAAELDDVWLVIRPEAERAGVSAAFIEATDADRHLSISGWRPHWAVHEVGCRSYERVAKSWKAGEVGCCTMRPCLMRQGR
jgi:hypothetical protein